MNVTSVSTPRLPRDPDPWVFWLTTSLCALFLLFVPGAPGAFVAL